MVIIESVDLYDVLVCHSEVQRWDFVVDQAHKGNQQAISMVGKMDKYHSAPGNKDKKTEKTQKGKKYKKDQKTKLQPFKIARHL